jgi:transcriptional regulator
MYIPFYTEVKERTQLIAFMKRYNFALLISDNENRPDVTPLPFVVSEEAEKIKLISHIARGNPQWKGFDESKDVLILFQGPHCYISPRFYESNINVPTWNYTMVAAYGKPKIFHNREKHLNLVHSMFENMEPEFRSQWDELPEEYKESLFGGIVGIEIEVEKLEGKFKLSQNKTLNEQKKIISGLRMSDDSLRRGVAELMEKNLSKNRRF